MVYNGRVNFPAIHVKFLIEGDDCVIRAAINDFNVVYRASF